jgi:hypothetical protein
MSVQADKVHNIELPPVTSRPNKAVVVSPTLAALRLARIQPRDLTVVLSNLTIGRLEFIQSRLIRLCSMLATTTTFVAGGSLAAISVGALAAGGVLPNAGHVLEMITEIAGGLLLLGALYLNWQKNEHQKDKKVVDQELQERRVQASEQAKTDREALAEHFHQKKLEAIGSFIKAIIATILVVGTYFALHFLGIQASHAKQAWEAIAAAGMILSCGYLSTRYDRLKHAISNAKMNP